MNQFPASVLNAHVMRPQLYDSPAIVHHDGGTFGDERRIWTPPQYFGKVRPVQICGIAVKSGFRSRPNSPAVVRDAVFDARAVRPR
jgi:hypothetical protein